MGYRLGVDVGGTFTDVLLINEETTQAFSAKVPSTPQDQSIGVMNGIVKACASGGIDPKEISHVTHGTTVATNAILTGQGAKVGLITTKGYRQTLQIARSFVPGGLGGWIIYNKSDPIAPLELTVEIEERLSADGSVIDPVNEASVREQLARLESRGVEAITVCLINSYANGAHERQVKEIAEKVLPNVPVSISSEVIPEMQEYERAVTTVANSFVRPVVQRYISNLTTNIDEMTGGASLHILRSDGGLASAQSAQELPVNLLMSGPAGGVSGAIWIAQQSGYNDLLTFDMGGTSTDVCQVNGAEAQTRRETTVGDVTVRASSVDVRTVGAGGGSIAHVPELTKALRVGPESAGAVPGPAGYGAGGEEPTVTDANIVLGYLPDTQRLGGDMAIRKDLAEKAVQKVADGLGLSLKKAAAGIIDIVNENMFGALRLVSVEQGVDPRDFALIGFGGAGPLHANALGRLMGSWPVIIPPGPGVLCAYGDATTRLRNESGQTFIRRFAETDVDEIAALCQDLEEQATQALRSENVPESEQEVRYQCDLRYHGQGLQLGIEFTLDDLASQGLDAIGKPFDELHTQLFTFALEADKEFVNLRAVAQGASAFVAAEELPSGGADPSAAQIGTQAVFMENEDMEAAVYQREKLKSGNEIAGPAIVMEMDSTTVILKDHTGVVDKFGSILISPTQAL